LPLDARAGLRHLPSYGASGMDAGRSLILTTTREAGSTVVRASGELDAATVQEFVWAIDGALDEGPAVLCLDLAPVTFADSSALAALVRTRRVTAWRGTALTVVVGDGAAHRLVELTGLHRLVDVYPTVSAALRLTGGSLRTEAERRARARRRPDHPAAARSSASSRSRSSPAAATTRRA
jgi:anti-anti-sigma factor